MVACSELYATARARIGLNFADGRLDDNNMAGVLAVINSGLAEMSMDHDWDWLYTEGTTSTVAGTEAYAVPTNYLRTSWMAINDGEIRQGQRRQAVRYYGANGYPLFYSIANGYFRLAPVPDGVYTVRHGYYTSIPKVTESTVANLANVTITMPTVFESLASLYIAKQIALTFKDQVAYNMVTTEIKLEKQRLDDNVRRSLGSMVPSTRQDA